MVARRFLLLRKTHLASRISGLASRVQSWLKVDTFVSCSSHLPIVIVLSLSAHIRLYRTLRRTLHLSLSFLDLDRNSDEECDEGTLTLTPDT